MILALYLQLFYTKVYKFRKEQDQREFGPVLCDEAGGAMQEQREFGPVLCDEASAAMQDQREFGPVLCDEAS
ncbi:hypothetical protein, partial [Paenisporosarcina sp. TG20]|uniref:hypothetical protein n=1 Tax=Paenisporosarcina sp. TG20 TaxID=1211706 RepID=UPI0005925992